MSEHLYDIDDFFKVPIEAHSEMPAATVWEAIENNFDKNNHVQLKKKYQTLKRVAAVLLLLLCGSIFFLVSKNSTNRNVASEKSNREINKNTTNEINNNAKKITENNLVTTVAENKNTLQNESSADVAKNDEEINISEKSTSLENVNDKTNSNIKNKISSNQKINQTKKLAINTIVSKNENIIYETNDENIFANNKNLSTKNKTNTTIKNAEITDDGLISDNKLRSSIILQERIEFVKPIFNSTINLPVFPVLNKINTASLTVNKNNKSHSFSATIYASPEFAFNRLEDDKPHQDRNPPPPQNAGRPRDDRDKIKREENKTTSFSAGILIDYSLNKKFTIQSGIGFTSKSTEVQPKKVFAELNTDGAIKYKNNCSFGATYIDPKTGVVTNVGDSANLGFTKNIVQYISFPLNILYHFNVGKFQMSPMIGVAANILVNQKATTNIEGAAQQNINKIEGVDKNYFNANIGFGIDYKLGKNMSIVVMPTLRLGLNALNTNSNVKFYSNTAGLMLGVKYGL